MELRCVEVRNDLSHSGVRVCVCVWCSHGMGSGQQGARTVWQRGGQRDRRYGSWLQCGLRGQHRAGSQVLPLLFQESVFPINRLKIETNWSLTTDSMNDCLKVVCFSERLENKMEVRGQVIVKWDFLTVEEVIGCLYTGTDSVERRAWMVWIHISNYPVQSKYIVNVYILKMYLQWTETLQLNPPQNILLPQTHFSFCTLSEAVL